MSTSFSCYGVSSSTGTSSACFDLGGTHLSLILASHGVAMGTSKGGACSTDRSVTNSVTTGSTLVLSQLGLLLLSVLVFVVSGSLYLLLLLGLLLLLLLRQDLSLSTLLRNSSLGLHGLCTYISSLVEVLLYMLVESLHAAIISIMRCSRIWCLT